MRELLVQILVWAALAYVVIGAVVMVVGFVTAMFSSESRPRGRSGGSWNDNEVHWTDRGRP